MLLLPITTDIMAGIIQAIHTILVVVDTILMAIITTLTALRQDIMVAVVADIIRAMVTIMEGMMIFTTARGSLAIPGLHLAYHQLLPGLLLQR